MRELSRLAAIAVLAACGRIGFDTTDVAVAPSCIALAPTCGPARDASCCESPLVPGGTFYRGYDGAADMTYADLGHPATIGSFRLDRYEVTVGRFRAFVHAGGDTQAHPPRAGSGAHALVANSGWQATWNTLLPADTLALEAAIKCDPIFQTWTDSPGANEDLPMVCVSWYDAMAFCAWDGGLLPTEAEWHYGASGGHEQRAYPWSNPPEVTAIDCSVASIAGCAGAQRVGATSPEGDGVWGQADLAGNVSEWVLDWNEVPYPAPCNDCGNVFPGGTRVRRGGGFSEPESSARAASRSGDLPSHRDRAIGVRCARRA